jgi:hypothetical protein
MILKKNIKFHKLSQMKQIIIKKIKINFKRKINEKVLSNFRGLAHKPRKREGKRGKKKKLAAPTANKKGCRSVQHSCAVN